MPEKVLHKGRALCGSVYVNAPTAECGARGRLADPPPVDALPAPQPCARMVEVVND